jgi:hypothetical protein
MRKFIFLVSCILFFGMVNAQNTTNTIRISVRNMNKHIAVSAWDCSVDVEGYDGDDLIIEADSLVRQNIIPGEAAGLRLIPISKLPEKNDELGYKVLPETNFLYQISITGRLKHLRIRVPNNLSIFSILLNSLLPDVKLSVKNLKGYFQIEGMVPIIEVSKVAGPFSISEGIGKITLSDIQWDPLAVSKFSPYPYKITSKIADIDVSLPENLKANLWLQSAYGRTFTDLNLKPGLVMNGGGIGIYIETTNGNIYLRKQK